MESILCETREKGKRSIRIQKSDWFPFYRIKRGWDTTVIRVFQRARVPLGQTRLLQAKSKRPLLCFHYDIKNFLDKPSS